MMSDLPAHAAAMLLMFVILPVWIAAGLADYLCHRASRIQDTSGIPESLMHLVQLGLIGIPTVLALFVQINAAFFLLAAAALLLHHAVAYLDIRYASQTREITPFEQMVHSFLELTPVAAFLLLAVLHWNDLLALAGYPHEPGAFAFRLKDHPLPPAYVLAAILAAAVFDGIPFLEEFIRCVRQSLQKN